MNCVPVIHVKQQSAAPARTRIAIILAVVATVTGAYGDAPAADFPPAEADDSRVYQVDYRVTPRPEQGGVQVTLTLRQSKHLLRELDMRMAAIDSGSIEADGQFRQENDRLLWNPPTHGGVLSWFAPVARVRSQGSYDAYIAPSWAVFRAEDIIPPSRTRVLKGARSKTRLRFDLPAGWSSTTQYYGRGNDYRIVNPARRFDQPTGWILLGNIGVRNDSISGVKVIIAGPVNHAVRRLDMMALLHWTLPELERILLELPARVTIISAAGPMWRGGLSAPASLFVHSELPLISENSTSTLLHEILHIGLSLNSENGADWIIEGLAEYYGLELLRRSNSISAARHENAIARLRSWGKDVSNLCNRQSSGRITARATLVFYDLDQELRRKTDNNDGHTLDDLVRQLKTKGDSISVDDLQATATQLAGYLPTAIQAANLPGCFE